MQLVTLSSLAPVVVPGLRGSRDRFGDSTNPGPTMQLVGSPVAVTSLMGSGSGFNDSTIPCISMDINGYDIVGILMANYKSSHELRNATPHLVKAEFGGSRRQN